LEQTLREMIAKAYDTRQECFGYELSLCV